MRAACVGPVLLCVGCAVSACSAGADVVEIEPQRVEVVGRAERERGSGSGSGSDTGTGTGTGTGKPPEQTGPCPGGMKLVDTTHCPEVRRTCLDDEYSKSNKITICHKFAKAPPRCLGEERRQRFCIDEFEYPNKEGARSPVMVDFHDAMALCAERGKRLCWESEWTSACEGPDKTPFPYGYDRSPEACNIENPWLKPSLSKLYDTDPAVAGAELTRLDQGVASGAKKGCVSGF